MNPAPAERGDLGATKRTVSAPSADVAPGVVLSVEVAEDEEVQWQWSHERDGQSRITGYQIVKREPPK